MLKNIYLIINKLYGNKIVIDINALFSVRAHFNKELLAIAGV